MLIRRTAIGLVLALLLTLPATAQDHQKGVAAYKRGDYATALKEWRPLAERGHANAQDNLGLMYTKGLGVPQDYAAAVKWYRKAAEQGHAGAQMRLGVMYIEGIGVPKDDILAYMWLNHSAANGDKFPASIRDGVARRLTRAQIAEAKKLTREWQAKHGKK